MLIRSTLVLALVAAAGCKGEVGDTSVEVNAAPSVASVFVTPDPAVADDILTCSWVGYSDPEGDVDLSSARWTVNGADVGEGHSLSGGFAKGDEVACSVVPFDGNSEGEAVSASVTIGNMAPSIALADISPDPAASDDVLTCSWQGFDDPDGDADESMVTWAVNGINAGTGLELSGGFGGGDVVTCYVTPFDGEDEGVEVSASVTIENVAPTVDAVVITPDPAYADDTLVCSWTGYADADGDADQSSSSWKVNGAVVGSGRTLSGRFEGGDLVECVVTPFDGKDSGPNRTGSATVADSPPAITGVSISPVNPGADDILTCAWTGYSDLDGDADRSKVEWSVGGTPVGAGTTLLGAFARGDTVTCEVTPFDGVAEGTPLTASVDIANGLPNVAAVTVTPNPAYVGDVMSCGWTGFSDPDGDSDQSVVSWSVNGLSAGSTPTLSGVFAGRDSVQCTVTPYDGEDAGISKSSSVVVTNSIPSITSVSLSPQPAFADDVLSCSWSGFFDADGDNDQTRAAWKVNGVDAGFGVSLSGVFSGGDLVECTATPSDGYDNGTPLTASTVIGSSAPSVTGVFISPNPAVLGDTLTCGWTFVDIDGDPDASTVGWTVNSAPAGTGPTLAGGFTSGDTVQCTVTPSDGTTTGSPVSTSIVVNTPPTVASAAILPDPAGAGDALSCSWTGFADVDGDSDVTAKRWLVNDANAGAGDQPTLPYVRGDLVECVVMPYDGYSFGTNVVAQVVIANTAPSLASVTVTPPSPNVGDTVSCSMNGYADVDGDGDESTITWYVDDLVVGTGPTLDSGFGGGDTIVCEATPYDGFDEGTPVSGSVVANNTAPVMVSVTISPTPVYTDTVASVTALATDADGDALSYTHQWFRNGLAIAGATEDTLDGTTQFSKNDILWVTSTPTDGNATGASMTSASVAVSNTAPSAPIVEITATGYAADGDDLICGFSTPALDPDGDALSYTYQWFRNSSLYPDYDDTIASSATGLGEEWLCSATAFDGVAYSTPGSGTVTIGTPMASEAPERWTPEESPYYLVGDVLIPPDSRSEVLSGAMVDGRGFTLEVSGALEAFGTLDAPVVLQDLHVSAVSDGSPFFLHLDGVEMFGGSLWREADSGELLVRDSVLYGLDRVPDAVGGDEDGNTVE